jgi:hypothetical protein
MHTEIGGVAPPLHELARDCVDGGTTEPRQPVRAATVSAANAIACGLARVKPQAVAN